MASKNSALITTTSAHGEVEELAGGSVIDLPGFNALPAGQRFTKIKNNSNGMGAPPCRCVTVLPSCAHLQVVLPYDRPRHLTD